MTGLERVPSARAAFAVYMRYIDHARICAVCNLHDHGVRISPPLSRCTDGVRLHRQSTKAQAIAAYEQAGAVRGELCATELCRSRGRPAVTALYCFEPGCTWWVPLCALCCTLLGICEKLQRFHFVADHKGVCQCARGSHDSR